MKINNELGQISANNLNLSNDLNSKVPFPRDILKSMKSKTPINGKLLSQKGRVTPGQNNPVKLINQHIKSMHETGFNIITNKDWKESDKGIEENDRMISQTMSDYQDFTKCKLFQKLLLKTLKRIPLAQLLWIGNTMIMTENLKKLVNWLRKYLVMS